MFSAFIVSVISICSLKFLNLFCIDTREDRDFVIKIILDARQKQLSDPVTDDEIFGDNSPRLHVTPIINMKATNLKDVIDWSDDTVHEPPLTCEMPITSVREISAQPMEVPHCIESIERIVKKVTEASGHVFSEERRDAYIRGNEIGASLMERNRSKQDLAKLLKFKI